jgi:hypothetical protein
MVEALAPAQKPALMTAAELATELRVCSKTVGRMRDQGCPHVMVVDSVRYELPAVLEWLRARGAK